MNVSYYGDHYTGFGNNGKRYLHSRRFFLLHPGGPAGSMGVLPGLRNEKYVRGR